MGWDRIERPNLEDHRLSALFSAGNMDEGFGSDGGSNPFLSFYLNTPYFSKYIFLFE